MVGEIMAGASLLGKLFGGGAKKSAEDRQAQDMANVQRDRNRLQAISDYEKALQDRAQLEMDRREFDTKARQDAYRSALRSQYLQGWAPAQRPAGIETVRGGFNTIPEASKQAAAEFERQALLKMLNGEKFDSLPAIERFTPTPVSKPSTWEKLSGILGLGLTGASELYNARNKDRE